MKHGIFRIVGRLGVYSSAVLLSAVAFAYFLSLPVGYWIVRRFGPIPAWMIVEHMFESPSALPVFDLLCLIAVVSGAFLTSAVIAAGYVILCRKLRRRYGSWAAVVFALVAFAAMGNAVSGAFDFLDRWFSIRHEIACRRVKSDYFAKNYRRVDPSSVVFDGKRMNLVVVVSESLEERFAEGVLGGENLLPELVRWREGNFHADCQCQIAGASFTSAALTSMFYGIPRLRLDGNVRRQDTERYPRYSVPSIWDVFLTNGYACAYVQGGTFEFASKGRLFPTEGDFRKLGFDDLRGDPRYLAEPSKHFFGVHDEVMFDYLKRETLRLIAQEKPFVLFGLTMNPHCPDGWLPSSVTIGNRGKLAESIFAQDRMLVDYVRWLERQRRAEDTVVVVLGDHYYWGRTFGGTTPRRVFNAVRVPGADASPFVRSRRFSAVDWAPTFVELAGGKLPGDGHFGMGVSLLRETKTLLEEIDESRFDDEMQSSLADYWKIVLEER